MKHLVLIGYFHCDFSGYTLNFAHTKGIVIEQKQLAAINFVLMEVSGEEVRGDICNSVNNKHKEK